LKYVVRSKGCVIFLVCSVSLSFGSVAQQSVIVQDDFGKGIRSNVYVSLGESREPKGSTDDLGHLLLGKACERGKQIQALPLNPLYYEARTDCHPDLTRLFVTVTKKAYAKNLETNAVYFEAAGQGGNAAFVYTEIADRFEAVDSTKASNARFRAYLNFARAIDTPAGVEVARFDPEQGQNVLTAEFVRILKDYQRKKGLTVTGALDYKTLSSQANVTVGEILTVEIPFQ
jgi:hypothetical protein